MSEKISVFIVEDEEAPFLRLKALLLQAEDMVIVARAKSVQEALDIYQRVTIDLIFLDVELSDGNCFDFLRNIKSLNSPIVFATAHAKYAVEAFKFSALDYLLKPISLESFSLAIKRFKEKKLDDTAKRISQLLHNDRVEVLDEKTLSMPVNKGFFIEKIVNISMFFADGNYCWVYTNNGEKMLVYFSLKHYDQLLENFGFYRTHKSYLVNTKNIKVFRDKKLLLQADCEAEVSVRQLPKLKKILQAMSV